MTPAKRSKPARKPAPTATNRRELRRIPQALPRAIGRRLNALAAKVLHVSWLEGALWVVVAACAFILAQGAADWLFDLPLKVRGLFLLADIAIFAFLVYRFGVQPWQRRLTLDEAALYAERRWPDFQTGLISAVQLARKPDGSQMLVDALLDRMAKRTEQLDLRLAVEWKQLTRLFLVAILLVGVTGGLIVWLAPKSYILLQRMLLVNVPLPTQTIVVAVSKDFSIPVGQTIELSAKAKGVWPRSGRVEVTYDGKSPETVTVTPKASSPDTFSIMLPNIQQPLTYRFYLNDGRGEEWKVTLIHPPVVQEIKFEQTSPAYTGLPPTQLSAGGLSLLAGSKLKITGRSNQPLKSARLAITGGNRSIDMQVGADRLSFSGELTIPAKDLEGFSVVLKNDADLESQNNTIYAVEIVPDKPPEITIDEGQPEKVNMIVKDRPRLRFQIRDDFKIKQVFLVIQATKDLGEGEEPSPEKGKLIEIPIEKPAAGLAFNFEWKDPEKTVDWAEGTTFNYWIKAVDNNDVTGPGISYSEPRQWSVVSEQTKREELAEKVRQAADLLKSLGETQDGIRNDVGQIIKSQEDKK